MKEKPEKNGIEEDGHGLGHVIEKGDPGHVTSARDHVTENAAIEDEKFLEEELSRRHFVCCFLNNIFTVVIPYRVFFVHITLSKFRNLFFVKIPRV